jgi:diketogulonate reductase-like aldo/keto reductase
MELRELGSTGVMIPEVGLGTWKYRGGSAPLRRGIELGATFIDTAEVYRTEDAVAEAITGLRDRIFLATKVSGDNLSYAQVLQAAEASLKRLRTDVIDLYQIHWPSQWTPIKETMRAMEDLVDMGKVRYIGVSNFSRLEFEEAQAAMTRHQIVANQMQYSLLSRDIEHDIEDFYGPNKITLIAYSPLGGGALARSGRSLDAIDNIVAATGRTAAQVALNWCLSRPGVVVIPKSDRHDRVEEDCGASGWYLTAAQVASLDEAFA